MMKDVLITVSGYQNVDNDSDCVELKTVGKYGIQGGKNYIIYTEMQSYGKEVKTIIKTTDSEVVLEREGAIDSRMVISKGKRTHCMHKTEQGSFLFGVFGESVKNALNENGGKLEVAYHLDINSGLLSRNRIEITVKEV